MTPCHRSLVHTLAAVERNDYDTAAKEMMDSKWAKHDSPASARRLAKVMVRG